MYGVILNQNKTFTKRTIYGFHIDSSVSDPFDAVTYLEDAVGMTPAFMNFNTGVFNYGSWENAFFMPRPCMLKFDGTVDYYLDKNNYALKEDGTASDVADITYQGNAMMEWGQQGRIWYKVVPDSGDSTSASVYIANYKADDNYKAWSFINNSDVLANNFYTAIYGGSIDGNNRLRSMSGQSFAITSISRGITDAQNNNPTGENLWHIETFSDRMLITYLLVLMGKSLNSQAVFGQGNTTGAQASVTGATSGVLNSNGLFYGSTDTTQPVKIFGMENFWGNQSHRVVGLVDIGGTFAVKMTYGTSDGSSATGYNTDGSGYITASATNGTGYIKTQIFNALGYCAPSEVGGSASTYYCDYVYIGTGGVANFGGSASNDSIKGLWYVDVSGTGTQYTWHENVCLSCKPNLQ